MQLNHKKALIAFLLIFISVSSFSQYRKKSKFFEGVRITPRAGINMYFGDLVSQERTNYSVGLVFEKELTPYLNGRFSIFEGEMKGSQFNTVDPDNSYAYFKNFYLNYNIGATFRPLDLAYGLFKERSFNPYIAAEFGLIQYRSREWNGTSNVNYRVNDPAYGPDSPWRGVGYEVNDSSEFIASGYGFTPSISFGGGLSYWIHNRLSVSIELMGTLPFSDKLDSHDTWDDQFGTTYKTNDLDFYYTATFGISYLLDDSQWKNSPKYNRKAYQKTRSLYNYKPSKKKYKRPKPGRKRY